MAARVICMSRAISAGADEVAALVGAQLGFRCVDEEIISRVAERQNLDPEEVASAERRKSFLARLFEDVALGAGMAGYGSGYVTDPGVMPPRSDHLRSLIREAIVETAEQGNVVIVAHAASYALGGRDDVLRVFVTGSKSVRAKRLAASGRHTHEAAEEEIRQSDAARADYIKRFYEVDRELPEHYDISISTDALTPKQAADAIVGFAQSLRD